MEHNASETSLLFRGRLNAGCARPGGCGAALFSSRAARLRRDGAQLLRFCRLHRSGRLRGLGAAAFRSRIPAADEDFTDVDFDAEALVLGLALGDGADAAI